MRKSTRRAIKFNNIKSVISYEACDLGGAEQDDELQWNIKHIHVEITNGYLYNHQSIFFINKAIEGACNNPGGIPRTANQSHHQQRAKNATKTSRRGSIILHDY